MSWIRKALRGWWLVVYQQCGTVDEMATAVCAERSMRLRICRAGPLAVVLVWSTE